MNVAVVFFSLDGNTRLLAENVATELRADLIELSIPRRSQGTFERWIWADREIELPVPLSVHRPEIELADYDLVVLGTPVWAGSLSPVMRQFLSDHEFFRQRFAVIVCYSGRLGRTMREFDSLLLGNELIDTLAVREPLETDHDEVRAEVTSWVRGVAERVQDDLDEARGA